MNKTESIDRKAEEFMATDTKTFSMNAANPRDPFNNNSYGTLVDSDYKQVRLPILDVNDFNERIIRCYEEGDAEKGLPADLSVARSLIPAGTATLRDFSYIAPDIPEYIPNNCTGCMDCVTLCPDTAILGKVLGESEFEKRVQAISDPGEREDLSPAVVENPEVLRRPGKESRRRRAVFDHDRSQQMQGLRRVRDRVRRPGAENDSEDRAGDDKCPKEPSLVQASRSVR